MSEAPPQAVKIQVRQTDNSLRNYWHPNSERSRLPKPEEPRAVITVEPNRLRLILQRLQERFYDEPAASERIAAAVLVDVKHLDEGPPALPH